MNRSIPTALVAGFLFASGLCALIYQTVWLRELRLIFGASTAASAAVMGIFMGGLGLGSAWLGRKAEKARNPLAWYGGLELMIAGSSALTPGLLWLVRRVYIASGGSMVLGQNFATIVRLVLASLVLVTPTVLMGGTLPAVARAVSTGVDRGRQRLAFLYGTNTMGAVFGALVSTFFLLERFGNRNTLWLACGLNVLVALLAREVARTHPAFNAAPSRSAAAAEEAAVYPDEAAAIPPRLVFLAAGAVGFAFMLMELVWYRMLSPLLGGSTFTFGLILAIALFGIGVGGWLYSLNQVHRPGSSVFGWTCALEALFIAIPFALGDRIALLAQTLRGLGSLGFGGQIVGWSIVCAVAILPAAVVAGYQFPLLIALLGGGSKDVARDTGHAYAANTAGAILGSLAGGFGLLPALTAPGAWMAVVVLLALLAMVVGIGGLRRRDLAYAPAVGIALAACALIFLCDGPTAAWRHSGIGAGRAGPVPTDTNVRIDSVQSFRRTTVWEAEGVESSVGVAAASGYSFIINGKIDGNIQSDRGTQVMSGLLPCLFRPFKSAIVIGLGTGSTAGWLGADPEMEAVDVVELEPAVLEVARLCAPANMHVLENPKVKVYIGDAREALLTSPKKYDVVFSEPSNPYRAGIASLFTREFYEAVDGRLAPQGIFAQWIQGYEIDGLAMRTAYATLGSVFQYVQTWHSQPGDFILLASHTPFDLNAEALRARVASEPFRTALRSVWDVDTAEGVLARLVADSPLCRFVADSGAPIATDDRNGLEFGFARNVGVTGAGSLQQELITLSRQRGWDRLPVRGPIDWDAVLRERAYAFPAGASNLDAEMSRKDLSGARWRALATFRAGQHALFRTRWNQQPFEPASYSELTMLAEELTASGDPSCWRFIAQLYEVRPGDAEALWASAFAAAGRRNDALSHLHQAFEIWRNDPWAPLPITDAALHLALDLGGPGNRDVARKLFDDLRRPFCVMLLNERRIRTAVSLAVVASSSQSDPILAEAVALYGPHYPWEKDLLELRAVALRESHSALAGQAAADVEDFLQGEAEPFSAGLPEAAGAGMGAAPAGATKSEPPLSPRTGDGN